MLKKRLLFTICFIAFAVMPMMAQTDKAKEINRIKLSSDYLYAEATMKDEAEALSGAQAILEMTVADWMAGQTQAEKVESYVIQAKQHFTPIITKRGQYCRAFLYVKKDEIMTIDRSAKVVPTEPVERPAEEPSQQPTTETLVVTQTDPEVAVVTDVEEQPAIKSLTPEEQRLAAIMKFSDVEGCVTALDAAGKLAGYGEKKTTPAEGVLHMLVFNRAGEIPAVLRREEDGQLLHLRTLSTDNVKNYPDCGAIWLQFK